MKAEVVAHGDAFKVKIYDGSGYCSRDPVFNEDHLEAMLPALTEWKAKREEKPKEPTWRAYRTADEVPGHLTWARHKESAYAQQLNKLKAGRHAITSVEDICFRIGGEAINFAYAFTWIELAGPDLVWQPAGVLE